MQFSQLKPRIDSWKKLRMNVKWNEYKNIVHTCKQVTYLIAYTQKHTHTHRSSKLPKQKKNDYSTGFATCVNYASQMDANYQEYICSILILIVVVVLANLSCTFSLFYFLFSTKKPHFHSKYSCRMLSNCKFFG